MRPPRRRSGQRDPNSLVAAAALLTGPSPSKAKISVEAWQAEAWTFYDTVGELRFGTGWFANGLSRVNLIAAAPPRAQGDEPSPIDLTVNPGLKTAVDLVASIAGGPGGQGQLLAAIARHLTVPGVSYVLAATDMATDTFSTWRALSNDEVRRKPGASTLEYTSHESGEWQDVPENDLLFKVWRSHPRKSWEPDSPVRAVLPTLREIDLLTKRIAADAKSRLLGNGLIVFPESAVFPEGQGNIHQSTNPDAPIIDEFIETFLAVTNMAIADQESAAASTPLVVKVPDETVGKIQHLTFYSEFAQSLDTLRQAAIRRLALGLDMPPEVLMGMGASNHWSAWQVEETAVTLHIEPMAETICHAFTEYYLKPALKTAGLDPDAVIVWYDTTDLQTRPDRSAAAGEAHARIKISDAAYLREIGLDEDDKPSDEEFRRRVLLDVAKGAPTLAPSMLAAAGILPEEVAQAAADAPTVDPAPPAPEPAAAPAEADGPPAQQASALVAAADQLVYRALERAGARLRTAAGKSRPGGAAAIPCADTATLHTLIAATEYASIESLLDDAWTRAPEVAARHGLPADALVAALDGYARGLIAAGRPHRYDLLADVLGHRDDRPIFPPH